MYRRNGRALNPSYAGHRPDPRSIASLVVDVTHGTVARPSAIPSGMGVMPVPRVLAAGLPQRGVTASTPPTYGVRRTVPMPRNGRTRQKRYTRRACHAARPDIPPHSGSAIRDGGAQRRPSRADRLPPGQLTRAPARCWRRWSDCFARFALRQCSNRASMCQG